MNSTAFHRSVFLTEQQLHAPEGCCPICGNRSREFVVALQRAPDVELLRCEDCHAASASRMPTEDALAEYYREYYRTDLTEGLEDSVTVGDSLRFGRHLAAKAWPILKKELVTILDYGGGDGTISMRVAEVLLAKGASAVRILVVDYNESLPRPADQRISMGNEKTLDGVQGSFDFVIASAIVEHVSRPAEVLERLFALMSPGGVFYARTPNIASLMRCADFLGVRLDFTFPAHLHDFGQDFWEQYVESHATEHQLVLISSRPSIVETRFRRHFLRTVAAYLLKAPWMAFGRIYTLVGGWEVFCRKAP